MKWVSIFLTLLSMFVVSCDTPTECTRKALKMGIDVDLCQTSNNRLLIKNKFRNFSRGKIGGEVKVPVDCSTEIEKIAELEANLKACQNTEKICDVPLAPLPFECNCLDPTESWRE